MANVRVITADMNGFDPGYLFEPSGGDDWMARNFFTGGLMPSADLVSRFPDAVGVEHQWVVEGRHYERTANLWLANVDERREQALRALSSTGSGEDPAVLLQRWRIFFMACAELWGYGGGSEWWVSHYLLTPR